MQVVESLKGVQVAVTGVHPARAGLVVEQVVRPMKGERAVAPKARPTKGGQVALQVVDSLFLFGVVEQVVGCLALVAVASLKTLVAHWSTY